MIKGIIISSVELTTNTGENNGTNPSSTITSVPAAFVPPLVKLKNWWKEK